VVVPTRCLVPRGSGRSMMSRLTAGLIGAQKTSAWSVKTIDATFTFDDSHDSWISDPRGASGGIRSEQHPDSNGWLTLEPLGSRGWICPSAPIHNSYPPLQHVV
jgi:hypothetical protein